jgi:hypothetical protein
MESAGRRRAFRVNHLSTEATDGWPTQSVRNKRSMVSSLVLCDGWLFCLVSILNYRSFLGTSPIFTKAQRNRVNDTSAILPTPIGAKSSIIPASAGRQPVLTPGNLSSVVPYAHPLIYANSARIDGPPGLR